MKRDQALDFLRATAMVWIVCVFHLSAYSPLTMPVAASPLSGAVTKVALSVFMLMSGYLLGKKYSGERAAVFYRKRLLRIYPLFALSVITFFGYGGTSLTQRALSLTGLSVFVPGHQMLTVWFVALILVFYLFFPIISRGSLSARIVKSAVIYAALSLYMWLVPGAETRSLWLFPCFAAGVLAGGSRRGLADMGWGCVAIAALVAAALYPVLAHVYGAVPFAFAASFAVIGAAEKCRSLYSSVAFNRLVSKIAYASFGAYLFHRQILMALQMAWDVVFNRLELTTPPPSKLRICCLYCGSGCPGGARRRLPYSASV